MKKNTLFTLIGAVLAVLFGYLVSSQPGLFLMFSPVFITFLYGFSGIIPPVIMSAVMCLTGGVSGAIMAFVSGILPSAVMIFSSFKGYKFFSQVRNAMIAELMVFVLLLVFIKTTTGQDFSAFFKTAFDEMFLIISEEEKEALAEIIYLMTNPDLTGEVQINAQEIITQFSETIEQTLTVLIPMSVVFFSVFSGAGSVLIMNWIRSKREEKEIPFVPLKGWRLSKQVTLGLIIVYIAVLIISKSNPEAGFAAELMVLSAVICASFIQASASILSRFSILGMSTAKRTIFLFVLYFVLGVFFAPYGIMSALFGSKGLFIPKIRMAGPEFTKDNKEVNDEDNNENKDETDKEE